MTLNISHASDMSSALNPSVELVTALPKTRVSEKITVTARPLDDVFTEFRGDASMCSLKIDTQGFERSVLQGATQTLKQVTGIFSLFPLYEGEETYLTFLNDLHQWGFAPHLLVETTFFAKAPPTASGGCGVYASPHALICRLFS